MPLPPEGKRKTLATLGGKRTTAWGPRILSSRDRISEHLRRLKSAWGRAEIREKSIYFGAAALLATALGVLVAQLGSTALGIATIGTAIVGVLLALLVISARTLAEATGEGMRLARMAETLAPELGTGPTSAVDLVARLAPNSDPGFSPELAEAHLDRMADALGRAQLVERLAKARQARDRRAWKVLAGAGVVVLVALVGLRTGRARLTAWLADPTAPRISDTPIASDITLSYHFPAYTGLTARVVEGGDGSINAVVGTQVDLSATADTDVRTGVLHVYGADGKPAQDVPLQADGKKLRGALSVMRDGTYAFELTTRGGERLQDGLRHPIRATLDASPEIVMDSPPGDVELKDDHSVDIVWHARDDFGIAEVALVVEREDATEPSRTALPANGGDGKAREGVYRWSVAELGIKPGDEVRFHLEVQDNDTINGPKKTVTDTHRLTIFSAKQRHEDLLDQQRQTLDDMVQLLGDELEKPFPREMSGDVAAARDAQSGIIEKMQGVTKGLELLVTALRDDKLTTAEVAKAFENIREHVIIAERERRQALAFIGKNVAQTAPATRKNIADKQAKAVSQLEKDIIYLDDLLAMEQIHELKETARDLLATQRDLQKMLADYQKTKDPALKAELLSRIGELKEKMMGLLAKMSQIKQGLPGEYRNMEAATMLQMDDSLSRIDKMLREGDLDGAARELEQLANAVENMVNEVNEAEQEFGGERYDGLRKQLGEFAQEFRELEKEQRELAQSSEELLRNYRKEAVKRAGLSPDDIVKKAREKTQEALRELDKIGAGPPLYGDLRNRLQLARQRLMDMDSLLEERDYAEARAAGATAEDNEREMEVMLNDRVPYGGRDMRAQQEQAAKSAERALERTREVNAMLDKLFPDPSQVMSPDQMSQLQRNQRRQQQLEQQARQVGQKMDQLSEEVPLFGGDSRAQLENARGEMDKAVGQLQGGRLPGAAAAERRAADQLGKLRESLERASQSGSGQLPLPLAGSGGGQGRNNGGDSGLAQRDVQIPQADKNRASPRFRQELLEAAKQKAPQNYEDAVRKYYEELIK